MAQFHGDIISHNLNVQASFFTWTTKPPNHETLHPMTGTSYLRLKTAKNYFLTPDRYLLLQNLDQLETSIVLMDSECLHHHFSPCYQFDSPHHLHNRQPLSKDRLFLCKNLPKSL